MKRAVIVRGALIAFVGLCTLLPGCTEDCEEPKFSDTLSQSSEDVPKGTRAIRCIVVTRCADPYALNGKYAEGLPEHFMMRDRGSSLANQKDCTNAFRHGNRPSLECVDIVDFAPICEEVRGGNRSSPDVHVTVGVGAAAASGDYYIEPAPNEDGAGEAPEQEGAEPGAGET